MEKSIYELKYELFLLKAHLIPFNFLLTFVEIFSLKTILTYGKVKCLFDLYRNC